MSSASTRSGSFGDELTNLALGALIGAMVLAGALRLAGNVAAFLTGAAQPTAGLEAGFGVVFHADDPGSALGSETLHPVAYWLTAGVMVAGAGVAGWFLWRFVHELSRRSKADPNKIVGIAETGDIVRSASDRALLTRAGILRPSLDKPRPVDVG